MENVLTRQLSGDVQLLEFKGVLTQEQYDDLQMTFIELFDQKKYQVIINLDAVENFSLGLMKLFSWAAEIILNNKGRLIVCGPSPELYDRLDKVGLDELLEIVPDLDFAKELFEVA